MAYLHNDDDKQQSKPMDRPQGEGIAPPQTSGLLAGYVAQPLAPSMALAPSLYGTGGSGPTTTGHVNFDSIYAANEGTAKRDAAKYGQAARGAAQNAQKGLGQLQSQFTSQSVAAQGSGPTQAQRDWAARGSTGVLPGKAVTDAHFYAPGGTQAQPTGPGGYSGKAIPDEHRTSEVTTADAGSDDAERRAVAMGYPDNNGKKWDSVASYDEAHSSSAGAGNPTNPNQSYVTEEQEGLDSGGYRPPLIGPDGKPVPGTGYTPTQDALPGATKGDADLEAAVRAGAAGKYGGPNSLQDLEGYKGLLGDYGKAERSLSGLTDDAHLQGMLDEQSKGAHIEGGSKLDAALTGAAGREDFARLRQQYKGLGGELGAADKSAGAQAAQSRAAAEQNASQYKGLLSQYEGRVGADTAAETKRQAGSDKVMADAAQRQQDQLAYNEAMRQKGEGLNGVRNTLHGVAHGLNPVDWVARGTGHKTPTEAGSDYYGQQFAGDKADKFNAGNASDAWGPDDADVFASMTPEDWTQFNSMTPDQQRAWIAARKKKTRGGGT